MSEFDHFDTQIQCEEAFTEESPEAPLPSWLTSKAPMDPMDEFDFIAIGSGQ